MELFASQRIQTSNDYVHRAMLTEKVRNKPHIVLSIANVLKDKINIKMGGDRQM